MTHSKKKLVRSIRLHPDVLAMVRFIADKEDKSQTEVIEDAIDRHLRAKSRGITSETLKN